MSSKPSTGQWWIVESKLADALKKHPQQAHHLMYPVVDPEADEPLGALLAALEDQSPEERFRKYQETGGPDPSKATSLEVLKGFVAMFQMWTGITHGDSDPI